jgi:hypothetical protein
MQVTISADEEFSITVCGAGSSCSTSDKDGDVCGSPNQIGFTSSTGDDFWVNASRVGGAAQSASCPIVNVSNDGNVALQINISTDQDIDSVDACDNSMELHWYPEDWLSGDGTNAYDLNDTSAVVWSNLGLGSDLGFWLWLNTSGCDDVDDISLGSINLYVNSTTV